MTVDIFMLDHSILNFSDNRIDTKSGALQHRYRVIVVDQVSLGARLTYRHATILKLLSLLLFVNLLLLFLCNKCLFNIQFAQATKVID